MNRKAIAEDTLACLESGCYTFNNENISIKNQTEECIKHTILYKPDDFDTIHTDKKLFDKNYETAFEIINNTTLECLYSLRNEKKLGCLNFASARNPGGGFMGGAQAQEESLARSSSLYPSLYSKMEMYGFNRSRKTLLYSDYMIYSPDVIFFKDDNGNYLQTTYTASVLTSPAVNVGAIKNNRPSELEKVHDVMIKRTEYVLSVFLLNDIETLVLGAWGCGVFQNNPKDVASYFSSFLLNGGKYSRAFKKIVFAIYDKTPAQQVLKTFRSYFNQSPSNEHQSTT